jgi:hypothetical protein
MTIFNKSSKERKADAKKKSKKRAKLKALEKSAEIGEKKRIEEEKNLKELKKDLKKAEDAVKRGQAKARKYGVLSRIGKSALKEAKRWDFSDPDDKKTKKKARK